MRPPRPPGSSPLFESGSWEIAAVDVLCGPPALHASAARQVRRESGGGAGVSLQLAGMPHSAVGRIVSAALVRRLRTVCRSVGRRAAARRHACVAHAECAGDLCCWEACIRGSRRVCHWWQLVRPHPTAGLFKWLKILLHVRTVIAALLE